MEAVEGISNWKILCLCIISSVITMMITNWYNNNNQHSHDEPVQTNQSTSTSNTVNTGNNKTNPSLNMNNNNKHVIPSHMAPIPPIPQNPVIATITSIHAITNSFITPPAPHSNNNTAIPTKQFLFLFQYPLLYLALLYQYLMSI